MIEVLILKNAFARDLADALNDGWAVMHMEFTPVRDKYEDGSTRGTINELNVVLQRAVADGLDHDSIPLSKRLESDDLESDLENALWDDEDDDEDEDRDPAINPDEIPF